MLGVKLVDYEVDSFAKVDHQSMNEVDEASREVKLMCSERRGERVPIRVGMGGLSADRLKIFTLSSREALGNEIRALDREELTLVLDEVCARACAIRVKEFARALRDHGAREG